MTSKGAEITENLKDIETGAAVTGRFERTWGSRRSREPPKCQGPQGITVQQGEVSRGIRGFSDHPFPKGSEETLQRRACVQDRKREPRGLPSPPKAIHKLPNCKGKSRARRGRGFRNAAVDDGSPRAQSRERT